MQRALLASVLVGALTALVGTYVVLKGLAFIGDAIAHAAFPGVVIAFMLKLPIYPAAIAAALLTALGIGWVSRRAAIRLDTAIGVVFAGAFAAGVLLMSTLKGYVGDLMSFLFGNVLAVTVGDLIVVASSDRAGHPGADRDLQGAPVRDVRSARRASGWLSGERCSNTACWRWWRWPSPSRFRSSASSWSWRCWSRQPRRRSC